MLVDKEEGNTITCQQLDYDSVSKSGRLVSQAPAMAQLLDTRGGYLAGQDIHFDQAQRILEINGPGEAAEPTSPAAASREAEGPSKIQWTRQLLVRFQQTVMPMPLSVIPLNMPDKPSVMTRLNHQTIFEMRKPARRSEPLTGNPLKGLMAESAVISGDAMIQRGSETIRAEKLAIAFLPAEARGKTFGPIQSAVGEGQVHLAARQQDISADSLDVHFVPVGPGRSTPNRAIAQGHAVASQDKSRIEADFLDATLAQVSIEAGHGAEAAPNGEKMKSAVVALTASGNVHITDPDQDMDMIGSTLTASMPDGRQVKDVAIKGTASAPARITMKDYALSGPSIEANLQSQDLVLPSAGSVKLLVRQGPEGTRLDKARPMVITWTDRMQMWGTRNQALFEGHVQAIMASTEESGDDTAVTSDRMTVYFRAVSEGEQPQQPVEPSPAFKLVQKAREQIVEVMPAAAEWLPASQTRRASRPALASAAQREPIKILAEGNAKAVSSRYDASRKLLTSRLLVEGPTFIADLGRQHLEVPGQGKLLIEDYSIAKAAAPVRRRRRKPRHAARRQECERGQPQPNRFRLDQRDDLLAGGAVGCLRQRGEHGSPQRQQGGPGLAAG